ncbi:hypothetical protein ALW18_12655 [Flavobacterium psychrophilum]|nr:hypothetical protein ALW18_12655 [Flavobacterium psychrophilum]
MRNKLIYLFILLLPVLLMAQERQTLEGRVVSGANGVPGVFIINKTAGLESKTSSIGYFSIKAKKGDAIIVYNSKIIVREFILTAEALAANPYIITVNYSVAELDEVVITKYGNINAESLGLVPKGQKKRTVAERRLYTAGAFTVGTVIGLDPIINAISGRTRMLKRAYETEKQETVISSIRASFDDEEISQQYNIPKEHVDGFLFYLAENKDFTAVLKQGNKQYVDFMMMEQAKAYLKLQQDGK